MRQGDGDEPRPRLSAWRYLRWASAQNDYRWFAIIKFSWVSLVALPLAVLIVVTGDEFPRTPSRAVVVGVGVLAVAALAALWRLFRWLDSRHLRGADSLFTVWRRWTRAAGDAIDVRLGQSEEPKTHPKD